MKDINKIGKELHKDLGECVIYTEEYLTNKLKEIYKELVVENRDMKRYIIDTHSYGIDYETMGNRVEKYRRDLRDST